MINTKSQSNDYVVGFVDASSTYYSCTPASSSPRRLVLILIATWYKLGKGRKEKGRQMPAFFFFQLRGHAWEMALTGQVSTHAPQSMQVSGSMTLFSPTSLMALVGQDSSHAPQLMHSSEIT
jgi:hypothetical protein